MALVEAWFPGVSAAEGLWGLGGWRVGGLSSRLAPESSRLLVHYLLISDSNAHPDAESDRKNLLEGAAAAAWVGFKGQGLGHE